MSFRKLATLAGVVVFGSAGDVCLKRGMTHFGEITLGNWHVLIQAIFTPWVAIGILLLILFFANYLSALSFADLTYVLPATSIGYIGMALLARFFLHEQISPFRWAGILLIAVGVGFIARGPSLTVEASPAANLPVPEPLARGKA
ncbi:MAG TPA: EamA family transporter [Terriglobales bacterium]|nr:EamA family transporter [Terriglobales bacterium]